MSVILVQKVEAFKERWKEYVTTLFSNKHEGDDYTLNLLRMQFDSEESIITTIDDNVSTFGFKFDGQYYNYLAISTVHAIFAAEAIALRDDCAKRSQALGASINMGIFNDVINSQLDANSDNINYASSSSSSEW